MYFILLLQMSAPAYEHISFHLNVHSQFYNKLRLKGVCFSCHTLSYGVICILIRTRCVWCADGDHYGIIRPIRGSLLACLSKLIYSRNIFWSIMWFCRGQISGPSIGDLPSFKFCKHKVGLKYWQLLDIFNMPLAPRICCHAYSIAVVEVF